MKIIALLIFLIGHPLTGQISILQASWKYVPGNKTESLDEFTIPDFSNSSSVELPHRIMLPDQSLWYLAQYKFTESGYLKINADDGAQLWIGNNRIKAVMGNFFPVKSDSISSVLMIRVLNNAMAGGLTSVTWVDEKNFQDQHAKWDSMVGILKNLPKFENPSNDKYKNEFSFSFWGDSQGGWPVFKKHIHKIGKFKDPLSIGLGDLVANGSDPAEWIQFLRCLAELPSETQMVNIPGNHDYDGYYDSLEPEFYLEFAPKLNIQNTYFAFTTGGCAFLALDPNRNFPLGFDREQLIFADSVFKSTSWQDANWRILLVHQPPYGQGWDGYSGEPFIQKWMEDHP